MCHFNPVLFNRTPTDKLTVNSIDLSEEVYRVGIETDGGEEFCKSVVTRAERSYLSPDVPAVLYSSA